jgi:hypothetical protein
MIRLEGERPSDQVDGGVGMAALRRDHAEKMQALDVVGIGRADLPVQGLGLGEPAGLVMRECGGELLRNPARVAGRRRRRGETLALTFRGAPLFSIHGKTFMLLAIDAGIGSALQYIVDPGNWRWPIRF